MPRPNAACRFTCAVDDDLVGPVELRRVAVGRRERQQDPVLRLHVHAVPVHVLLDQPGHGDRRVGAEELLHRGRQQAGLGDQPRDGRPGSGPGATATTPIALQVVSMPAISSRAIVPATCSGVELLAVDLGVDEVGGEVVARVVEVVVDLLEQVVEQPLHPLDAVLGRQVDALEHALHELAEPRPVLRREAEHVGDDPHRDVLRVLGGGVDHVLPLERVDERVAERPGGRLLPADRGLGERGEQQLARVVVERRVGGDRRRAADRGHLGRRPEVAHDDRPRGEALGVVGDRRDVLVPGRQPSAAEPLGVRDRAALPQVVLDRIGVGGPLRLQVGEVGRPVGDRPGDDLAADAELLVGIRRLVDEPVVGGHVRSPRSRARGS